MVGGVFCTPAPPGGASSPRPHIDTSYIGPTQHEILDYNIRYTYAYDLIVGSVREIRSYATARARPGAPDYQFRHNRQHWWYRDATDSGWPIRGKLRVHLGNHTELVGPKQLWQASAVRTIYLRAAFRTRGSVAHLFWSVPDHAFSSDRRVEFAIVPDGRMRTYKIDLAGSNAYRGPITGLRLDPPEPGPDRRLAEIVCISASPC
jgi:hypothetical protein